MRIFLVTVGAGLMVAASFVVFSLMGASWDVYDAATFAILGGAAFAVGAMRRDPHV